MIESHVCIQESPMNSKLNGDAIFSPRKIKIKPVEVPDNKPEYANEILYTDPIAPG